MKKFNNFLVKIIIILGTSTVISSCITINETKKYIDPVDIKNRQYQEHTKGCERNDGKSCYKLAVIILNTRFPDIPNIQRVRNSAREEAKNLFIKSCKLGYAKGCERSKPVNISETKLGRLMIMTRLDTSINLEADSNVGGALRKYGGVKGIKINSKAIKIDIEKSCRDLAIGNQYVIHNIYKYVFENCVKSSFSKLSHIIR